MISCCGEDATMSSTALDGNVPHSKVQVTYQSNRALDYPAPFVETQAGDATKTWALVNVSMQPRRPAPAPGDGGERALPIVPELLLGSTSICRFVVISTRLQLKPKSINFD
jgi:hypothetical protein